MSDKGSSILTWTVSYGDRPFLPTLVPTMRAAMGTWSDWAVFLGAPSPALSASAKALLAHPERLGIQYLLEWPENRGQHWAFKEALALAREKGYEWLLRLDDDVTPKSKGWLVKMLAHAEELKRRAGDTHHRAVFGPKIIGLRYPIPAIGVIEKGQSFQAEIVPIMGGACRLHPMELFDRFEPDIYAPLGRGDPERVAAFLEEKVVGGMLVRFPGIRMVHQTSALEAKEDAAATLQRKMARTWCYLGAGA